MNHRFSTLNVCKFDTGGITELLLELFLFSPLLQFMTEGTTGTYCSVILFIILSETASITPTLATTWATHQIKKLMMFKLNNRSRRGT